MRRPRDWFRQAELDLEAGRDARDRGRFEWACFAAHQAGEKAVKALHEAAGVEAWGHSIAGLLGGLDEVPSEVVEAGKRLDKHYIPTRYPNAHLAGAPGDLYTGQEAAWALADAEAVVEYVRGRLPSS